MGHFESGRLHLLASLNCIFTEHLNFVFSNGIVKEKRSLLFIVTPR